MQVFKFLFVSITRKIRKEMYFSQGNSDLIENVLNLRKLHFMDLLNVSGFRPYL